MLKIEELNEYIKLFDTYGELLSKKQFELMDKHLNLDLAESELAMLENISRQSVHDAITKAKKILVDYENKCHIVEQKNQIQKDLVILKNLIENNKTKEAIDLIDKNLK